MSEPRRSARLAASVAATAATASAAVAVSEIIVRFSSRLAYVVARRRMSQSKVFTFGHMSQP